MKRLITILLSLCLLLTAIAPLAVSAEEDYWYTGATITKKMGTIDFKGSSATLACDVPYDQGGNLGITKTFSAPNHAVTAEFKVRIEGAWTTRETIVIYTGTHRAYIGFRSNGITCQDKSGTATVIPCNVGTTMNSYAVKIDSNGVAEFFFNGRCIKRDWQLPTNSQASQISIGGYGGSGGTLSKFTVSDVKITIPESGAAATATTSGDPPSLEGPPTAFSHEFTADEDLSEWRCATDAVWIDTEKGVLAMDQALSKSTAAFYRVNFADDFIIEHRMRFQVFGDKFYYKVHYPGGVFYVDIREQRIHTEEISGDLLPNGFLFDPENPDEWHTMKFESYGGKKYVKVYIDGELIGDFPTQPHTRAYYHLQIGAQGMNGTHAAMEYDWIAYTPIWAGDACMAAPMYGDEYLEGEPINLKSYLAEGVEADKVDYKVNGVVVATGTKENNYNAVLTGLPAGSYSIVASCNGKDSTATEFDVLPARENNILASWVGKDQASVELSCYDELDSVKSVEYLVNGESVGSSNEAPYKVDFSAKSTEGTAVVALCKNANGAVIEKLSANLSPDLAEGVSTHYANEISYDASENAEVNVANGMFQLKLNHQADTLTYLTNEGEKSIGAGAGNYKILTDGPFADLYYEGKLAASFRMPMSTQAVTTAGGVENFNISPTESRNSYMNLRNVTGKKTIAAPGLNERYYYNLDFVADKNDQAKLVVNDSIFSAAIELRDGKVYCKTSKSLDSEPYEYELGDMPEGENHYRLATELGMSNLYVNGKVLGSFRNARAVGEPVLGVDVKAGELSYLSLNDFYDIYLYSDKFNGGGTTSSEDYWYAAKGMTINIDPNRQEMLLIAKDQTNAIAHLIAYSGKTEFGADITVSKAGEKGGMWMLYNNSTAGTYSKAGYNFATGEMEIVDRQESDASSTKVSVPYHFEVGKTYRMELKMDHQKKGSLQTDKKVTLYVNGEPVLSKDTLDISGKVGFIATDATAYVKNFTYRGDAKPMLDVRDANAYGDKFNGSNTTGVFYSDGKMWMTQQTVANTTTDYGKTWKSEDMKALGWPKFSAHMLRLNSGELISLYKNEGIHAWGQDYYNDNNQKKYQLQFWINKTDTVTSGWEPAGYLFGPEPENGKTAYCNTVGGLAQSPDGPNGEPGRIFYVGDDDLTSENVGDTEMWYSDDKGMTWKHGLHISFESQGDSCMQEPQPVATKDWVRIYYRNDRGMIRYFESLDNGNTWNTESKSTPFFMALNCFGMDTHRYIDENGEMQEDIYVSWSNDSQNMGARYQFNRTNYTLAVSKDYGDSWEFLGTTHRNSAVYTGQMNQSLFYQDGYLVTNGFTSQLSTTPNPQGNRPIVTPAEKQIPTMRIQQVQPLYASRVEIFAAIRDHKVDRSLIFNEETGMALLRGAHIENAVSAKGVVADYAASFLGATVVDAGNGKVTLKLGLSEETFDVVEENGIKYIPAKDLAERYGMYLLDLDGVKAITPYDAFTWRGSDAAVNAVSL